MKPWIKTDELQWVREVSENSFVVLDVTLIKKYILKEVEINFLEISDERMNEVLQGYYHSLDQVKEEYKNSWKQIVAEIIAEETQIDWDNDKQFGTIIRLQEYLQSEFGIDFA
jgi:hypothetical protein